MKNLILTIPIYMLVLIACSNNNTKKQDSIDYVEYSDPLILLDDYMKALSNEDIEKVMSLFDKGAQITNLNLQVIKSYDAIKSNYMEWFELADFDIDYEINMKTIGDQLSRFEVDISCNEPNGNGKKKFIRKDRNLLFIKDDGGWKIYNGFSFHK